jgi:hypothetical protein
VTLPISVAQHLVCGSDPFHLGSQLGSSTASSNSYAFFACSTVKFWAGDFSCRQLYRRHQGLSPCILKHRGGFKNYLTKPTRRGAADAASTHCRLYGTALHRHPCWPIFLISDADAVRSSVRGLRHAVGCLIGCGLQCLCHKGDSPFGIVIKPLHVVDLSLLWLTTKLLHLTALQL